MERDFGFNPYGADEEILVKPGDEPKVGLQKHAIHDPHDFAAAPVKGRHDERNVRRALMVDHDKGLVIHNLPNIIPHLDH